MGPQKYKNEEDKHLLISAAILPVFSYCMCPAIGWASERKSVYKNETEDLGRLVLSL